MDVTGTKENLAWIIGSQYYMVQSIGWLLWLFMSIYFEVIYCSLCEWTFYAKAVNWLFFWTMEHEVSAALSEPVVMFETGFPSNFWKVFLSVEKYDGVTLEFKASRCWTIF